MLVLNTRSNNSRSNDAWIMHKIIQTCFIYIEINSWFKEMKNISVICKHLISWVKKTTWGCIFWKLSFSLLIYSDENNIAKLVIDMSGNCSNRLCQLLSNWIQINIILKSASHKFYKINVLISHNSNENTCTSIKKTSARLSSCEFRKIFKNPYFYRTRPDDCFWIFPFTLLVFGYPGNQFLSIFEYVL